MATENQKESATLINIDNSNEEDEFLSWFETDGALEDVTFLLGKEENTEDDEEQNGNKKIFRLDRIITKDKQKRTALRILIEDSDKGISHAKSALDKSKKTNHW